MFVDSGPWIAVVSDRDTYHAAADRTFADLIARGIDLLTTNLVAAECHRWLLHRMGARAGHTFLAKLTASRRLTVVFASAAHHARALEWLERLADPRITYTDAVSFAVMEACRCRAALTYDRDFTVAGFSVWQNG